MIPFLRQFFACYNDLYMEPTPVSISNHSLLLEYKKSSHLVPWEQRVSNPTMLATPFVCDTNHAEMVTANFSRRTSAPSLRGLRINGSVPLPSTFHSFPFQKSIMGEHHSKEWMNDQLLYSTKVTLIDHSFLLKKIEKRWPFFSSFS